MCGRNPYTEDYDYEIEEEPVTETVTEASDTTGDTDRDGPYVDLPTEIVGALMVAAGEALDFNPLGMFVALTAAAAQVGTLAQKNPHADNATDNLRAALVEVFDQARAYALEERKLPQDVVNALEDLKLPQDERA